MVIQLGLQGFSYLLSHPELLLHAAKNAVNREITIPLALLRWGIDQRPPGKGPERIELYGADPALGLELTVDLYGTKLTVSSKITIESMERQGDAFNVALDVRDLKLEAPPGSPAAMMVGALDLSKPASLMKMMPQKHAALVGAEDNRFVIDLMKIKPLARNPMVRRALDALSFVRVSGTRVDGEVLALRLDVSPLEIPGALIKAASQS
jgi:hypothetical protein